MAPMSGPIITAKAKQLFVVVGLQGDFNVPIPRNTSWSSW